MEVIIAIIITIGFFIFLVVDQYGKVNRINCPFRVIALEDISLYIITWDFYYVEAVRMTLDLREVFIIKGKVIISVIFKSSKNIDYLFGLLIS